MIQRIQTIYLLIAAALVGVFLGLAGGWFASLDGAYPWLLPATYALGGLTAALALLGVFFYQNRALQGKVVLVAQLADLALVLVLAVALGLSAFGPEATDADLTRATVILLPVLAYVGLVLARRGVRRDIELVRSMDRLR